MIENSAKDIKSKVSNLALNFREKINNSKEDKGSTYNDTISYTVKFDDEDK